MTQEHKDNTLDRLVSAYEQMLERVHDAVEKAEAQVPTLKQNLGLAREKAVELGELTREEADKVATYIERDMHDAAVYLAETGQQLRDWWRFDLQQVEERVLDMFAKVADQTSVQLRELKEDLQRAEHYHTGEVTGPGTLTCRWCGKQMHFSKPGRIPPCPGCHGTEFRREISEGSEDES
jgi:LPS O-antigen subunit length determinant protein (WzzB/FepE family)